jgi:hypothetical protein
VVLALALALGACTTWGRQPVPRPGQDRFLPGPVRVLRVDNSTILLHNVTITADSVVGWEHTGAQARVAIATADVSQVEARRTDPVGSAMVVFVPIFTAVVLWASYRAGSIGTKY